MDTSELENAMGAVMGYAGIGANLMIQLLSLDEVKTLLEKQTDLAGDLYLRLTAKGIPAAEASRIVAGAISFDLGSLVNKP